METADPGNKPVIPHRRWSAWAVDSRVLFPLFGLLLLGLLWGATANLIRTEHAAANHAAALTSRELLETYEAQVVRAIREIDTTLKVVEYAYESSGRQVPLLELDHRALLPPDLLFVVSLADRDGSVFASTRPITVSNVADRKFFQAQLEESSGLAVSLPYQHPGSGEWTLTFSRRLDTPAGELDGIVMVSVDADYFVSGYDHNKLGDRGVLAILGSDGVVRAGRTGDRLFHDARVEVEAAIGAADTADPDDIHARLGIDPLDGEKRYTSARTLFDLPLTVLVGLSYDEHHAAVARRARVYRWRAAGASVALVLVLALLGRLSHQLSVSRHQALEAQIEHAQRVEYLAYHDGLTGLPNRSLFSKLLHQGIVQARRHERKLAVLFLDLDRFKNINDTLGHEAGDELLQEVGRRLKTCLRESDSVARLGGDEFVALLPEVKEETDIARVAQKVIAAISRTFTLIGQEFRVTASVGISIYPQDGLDEQTLKKNADIAMYKAKELGKNTYQFYSEALNSDSLERLALETSLRHALERNELVLHYQAKRDLRSGAIVGMEALLRWEHPDLGLVAPMQFIPIAEQSGLIVPIGRWVLTTACAQNIAWQKAGLPRLRVSVNLTARQFNDVQLLGDVAAVLEETGMEADLLELEISESMLLQDIDRTVELLRALKAMGVRIAVDDFGFGYSTLATLRQFPLDSIKIDQSFIRSSGQVTQDQELTTAIIAMGRTLSLTVVAQGVETRAQAEFLRDNACDEVQGFFLGRPEPAESFVKVLQAQGNPAGVTDLIARGTRKRRDGLG